MQPALFISHGAPTIVASRSPAARFLAGLRDLAPQKPTAILIASAHWETARPVLNAPQVNDTIHDFGGFPPEFYRMRYPAPGAPAVAERAAGLLREAGFEPGIDPARGLDHGAWTPLMLAWPEADVPVLQLSVQPHLDAAHHLAVGRALAPLREEGVLVIGSGSFTHDLRGFRGQAEDAPEAAYARAFADWVDQALVEGRTEDLLDWRRRAPEAARNHPTPEHFLPLFIALGAGGEVPARRLHRSTTFGTLRMDAFGFGMGAAVV